MFWELARGGVSEKDVDLQCPKVQETLDGKGIEMDLGKKRM